jgi:uncharacterized protein YprB with RNaseH-like and TPR domain
MNQAGQKSIVFLDIETNSQLSQIHLCVTKELRSGEVRCHHKADTLLKMLEEQPQVVAHNGISFDFPILNRLWNTKITPSMCIDTLVMLGQQIRKEEDRLQEGLAQDQQTLF